MHVQGPSRGVVADAGPVVTAVDTGWQEDGSYVPCPECQWTPSPDPPGPGVPVYAIPHRPGSSGHRSTCPTVALSPEAQQRVRTKFDEIDRARRIAWANARNCWIF